MTNLHLYIDGARQTPFSSDTIDLECASTRDGLGEYVQVKAVPR